MLQRGMTFRSPPDHGVILMSQRKDAPYRDALDSEGNLLYEGHDASRRVGGRNPKEVDQPRQLPSGKPTDNGKFADWTDRYRSGEVPAARFNVYEKLRDGIWTYRGPFLLKDYRYLETGGRYVFRFVLQAVDSPEWLPDVQVPSHHELQSRQIPTRVKQFVFKRDGGCCVICGSRERLHFDHDLPYSRGGDSATPENVRLLCAHHNLSKGAKIQ